MARNSRKSKMAMGSVEYGDIYSRLCETSDDGNRVPVLREGKFVRDQRIGRLAVDFGNDAFWFRPLRGTASKLSMQDVSSLVANDLIVFDNPASREPLIRYLMEYDRRAATLKEAEVRATESKEKAQALRADTKLQRSVRRNTRVAKLTWTLAMLGLVAIAYLATIPAQQPAPANATISGIGQDLGVDSDSLQQASYIQALGNGTELYGVVTNTTTKEVGDTSSGNGTVTEDIVFNPKASAQPIHMRPLYYDKSSFYQTQLTTDPSGESKTAIYLQNPNGYALGVSANQLMLVTGSGMTSTQLITPDAYTNKTADQAQSDIEDAQNNSASERTSHSKNGKSSSEASGSGMPNGWLGVDHASIGSDMVAASYWYTKGNSGKTSDKHRRIAILNIKDVLASGSSAVSSMDIAQINYQDLDSNYYAPEISQDTDSKGSTYLLAYMKQDYNGNTGFFVRRIQSDDDVLVESYTNTFSTQDLTGSTDPITNYRLLGNRLFFEQSGYIWMMNLSESKLSVTINGTQRTISRENAIRICQASDIYASVTSDEQRAADESGSIVQPVAHYTPMTLTTTNGTEYGIVFTESDTGDLVFQPAVDMTTAASGQTTGSGADSTANAVGSGDEAAIQELLAQNAQNNGYDRNMEGTTVTIPEDIIGMRATDAISALQSLHFTVKTTGGTGVVTSVSPSGSALYGSTVTLTLSNPQTSDTTTATQSSASSDGTYRQVEYSLGSGTPASVGNAQQNSGTSAGETTTIQTTPQQDANAANANGNAGGATNAKNAGNAAANAGNATAGNNANASTNANGSNGSNGSNSSNSNNGNNSNAVEAAATNAMQQDVGNGRIAIRDVQQDHATVVCFAVRGEQILWIEQDANSTTRHVKFSPIYYKDSRSTVAAYENAEAAQSALDNGNSDGSDATTVTTGIADSVTGQAQADATQQQGQAHPTGDTAQQQDAAATPTNAQQQQQQEQQSAPPTQ